ncbi:MAG: alpha/beta hydrolase [Gemmatimonadota bacterium]
MRAFRLAIQCTFACIALSRVFLAEKHVVEITEGDLFLADSTRLHYYVTDARRDTILVPLGIILVPELAALSETHTVLAYDPRGRGRSSAIAPADLRRRAFKSDVADLDTIAKHFKIRRATILGWSFYSLVAARYAIEHPTQTRRLILASPLAPRSTPWSDSMRVRYDARLDSAARRALDSIRVRATDSASTVEYCRANNAFHVPANMAGRGLVVAPKVEPCNWPNEWPNKVAQSTGRSAADLGVYDWRGTLAALRIPILVIHGDEDAAPIAGTLEWKSAPNAKVVRIPEAAHWTFLEAPDAFRSAVEWFIGTH